MVGVKLRTLLHVVIFTTNKARSGGSPALTDVVVESATVVTLWGITSSESPRSGDRLLTLYQCLRVVRLYEASASEFHFFWRLLWFLMMIRRIRLLLVLILWQFWDDFKS